VIYLIYSCHTQLKKYACLPGNLRQEHFKWGISTWLYGYIFGPNSCIFLGRKPFEIGLSEPQTLVFRSKSLHVQSITSGTGIGLRSALRNVASFDQNFVQVLTSVFFSSSCSTGRVCDCHYKTYKWENISAIAIGATRTRRSTSKAVKNIKQ